MINPLLWIQQKMPTGFLLRALLAVLACVLTFSAGTWWGIGIGKNQEKAKQTDMAIQERNAVITASQKMAQDNSLLNQKFDAWLAQYQQQSNALTEKVNDEISAHRNMYACRIPRVFTELCQMGNYFKAKFKRPSKWI